MLPGKLVQHQQDRRRQPGRQGFTLHHQQQKNQGDKSPEVIPASLKSGADFGNVRIHHTFKLVLGRVGVYLQEQRNKIQQGRQCGRQGNLVVGHLQKGGHHKSRRAHDGWQQHAAGGSTGFDTRGCFTADATFFHGRNRQLAGGQDIGDDTATQ